MPHAISGCKDRFYAKNGIAQAWRPSRHQRCCPYGVHSAPCQGAAGRGSSTASAIGAVHVAHVLLTRHARLLLVPTMLLLVLHLLLVLVWLDSPPGVKTHRQN